MRIHEFGGRGFWRSTCLAVELKYQQASSRIADSTFKGTLNPFESFHWTVTRIHLRVLFCEVESNWSNVTKQIKVGNCEKHVKCLWECFNPTTKLHTHTHSTPPPPLPHPPCSFLFSVPLSAAQEAWSCYWAVTKTRESPSCKLCGHAGEKNVVLVFCFLISISYL